MRKAKLAIVALPAVLAAAFLLLFGSASADKLCEDMPVVIEEAETCVAPYPEAETLKATSGSVVLVGKSFEVTCSSALTAKTEKDPGVGKGLEGQLTELTFSGCKGSCSSATAANTPYKALITATGEGNASLALSPKSGSPTVKLSSCTEAKVSCEYSAEKVTLDFGGGEPALIKAVSEPLKRTGGSEACPLEATLSGTYEMTQPPRGFVAPVDVPGSRFCTSAANEICSTSQRYTLGAVFETAIEGMAILKYEYSSVPKEAQCGTSVLKFKTTGRGAPLVGETVQLSFGTPKCGACTVTAEQQPYRVELEAKPLGNVDGNGTLALRSNGMGPPKFRIECGAPHDCSYEPGGVQGNQIAAAFKGGGPAKIEFVNQPLAKVAGSANCSTTASFTATYKMTSPDPATSSVFLTR